MRSSILSLLLCLVLIVALITGVGAHGLAPALQDYPESTPVARVDDRVLTVGELTVLLGMRSARYRAGASLTYGIDDLLLQARHAPIYERLAEQYRQAGLDLSASMITEVEDDTRSFARRQLYRQNVTSRIQPPTIEQLRTLYDELKETDLATPERFLIRRVQIPFTGDTEAKQAQARLEAMKTAYQQGGDIMAILRSDGINAPTRVFYPDQEPEAPFIEALRMAGNDEALPIQTIGMAKELVIRHLHIPSGSIPIESSIGYLNEILVQRQASVLSREFFHTLAAEDGMVQVIEENLKSSGELALESDEILVVGGHAVTRGELQFGLGWDLDVLSAGGKEELLNRVIASGVVQRHLLDAVIAREGLLEDPAVQEYRRNLADTLLVRANLADSIDRQLVAVTEEEALLRWRMKEAALGHFHGRLRFDSLSLTSTEGDVSPWVERFRKATSPAAFNEAAQLAMRERVARTLMSGLQDHISNMPDEVRDFVETTTLPAACVIPPDEHGVVMVFWITGYLAEVQPSSATLEQARREVQEERWQDAFEAMLTRESEGVRVEPLLRAAY